MNKKIKKGINLGSFKFYFLLLVFLVLIGMMVLIKKYKTSVLGVMSDNSKFAYFYKPGTNTAQTLSTKSSVIILTRGDEAMISAIKTAGYTGKLLQYLLLEAIEGPDALNNASTPVCTTAQKTFAPYKNQVANDVGEFCIIHDSIINKTAFDHDLNPNTPTVIADETWFLHNSSGNRLGSKNIHWDGAIGYLYKINPANKNVQEYFAARAIREIKGNANHTKTGVNEIFWDNLNMSMKSTNLTGQVEYTTESVYQAAIQDMVKNIYQALSIQSIPMWANLIGAQDETVYDIFSPYLNGGMMEDFLGWNLSGTASWEVYSPSVVEGQMRVADKWLGLGKGLIMVSQGQDSSVQSMYGYASYLMVDDRVSANFRHANKTDYNVLLWYPEYDYKLGKPLGIRIKQIGTVDVIYRRNYECGYAETNLTKRTGMVTVSTCQSGITPTPTVKPTATPTLIINKAPVFITSNILPILTKGIYYSTKISAYDVNTTDILKMTASGLPKGLSLSNCTNSIANSRKEIACNLLGTSSVSPANYSIVITVTDSKGLSVKKTFTLTIKR